MENPNDPANTVKLEEVTGGDKLREKPWRYLGEFIIIIAPEIT